MTFGLRRGRARWPGRGLTLPFGSRRIPAWAPLLATCLGQCMVVLDSTIVNVALPAMKRGLDIGETELQWIVNAYLLTLGGLILLGGRLGDYFGRKRVYLIGAGIFAVASLVGGLAPTAEVLLAARAVQGVGAALLAPGTLSLLTSVYTAPRERSRALALWNATAASAGALGIFLGGALTSLLGWRSVLFVNVPIAILVLTLGSATLPETLQRKDDKRLDVPGAVAITAALTVLVYAVVQTETHAWGSPRTLALFAAAAALFGVTAVIESRVANPLIPFAVVRRGPVATALAMMLIIGAVITATFFFQSLYLQQVRGYTPFVTGLLMLPFGLLVIATPVVAVRLTTRYGPRRVAVVSPAVAVIGLLWLSRWQPHGSIIEQMVLPAMVFGLGVSFCFFALSVLMTSAIEDENSGLGSGLLNAGRQVGGSIGLAALTVAAAAYSRSLVGQHGTLSAGSITDGYGIALVANAGLFFVGMVIVAVYATRARTRRGRVVAPSSDRDTSVEPVSS
ncbi:MAG TPA: MFS transporter [Solirubrobacteraceae bacterium]